MSRNVLLSLYESNDRDDFCFQVLTSLWPGLAPPGELHTSWKCQEISRDFSFGMSLVILNLSDTPTTLSSVVTVCGYLYCQSSASSGDQARIALQSSLTM